jgi:hypothetical protein
MEADVPHEVVPYSRVHLLDLPWMLTNCEPNPSAKVYRYQYGHLMVIRVYEVFLRRGVSHAC